MTEQELREKIVKILEEYRDWFIEEDYKRDIAKIDYIGIADALINACGNELVEIAHLAEVAEKALQYAVSVYRCDECPCLDCNAKIRGSQECIDLIIKHIKSPQKWN